MQKRLLEGRWESKKKQISVKNVKCKRGKGKRTRLRCKKHLLEGGGLGK